MKELKNITIGSDPESFVYNTDLEEFVSAIDYLPGNKCEPFHPLDLPEGFCIQTDNILAEFNIPASKLFDDYNFVFHILDMKQYINEFLKEINPALELRASSSEFINEKYLDCPQAIEFGCDPDFNAYTLEQNKKPKLIAPNFRSSGCHIHIGYDNANMETSIQLVKYLDAFVGIPSLLIDTDRKRRTLYGKAGCFRLQPWGVEWRVLSGYFIKDEETLEWVLNHVRKAVQSYMEEKELPPFDIIANTINKSNVKQAKLLIENFNL